MQYLETTNEDSDYAIHSNVAYMDFSISSNSMEQTTLLTKVMVCEHRRKYVGITWKFIGWMRSDCEHCNMMLFIEDNVVK